MIANEARRLSIEELLCPIPRTILLAEDDPALRHRLADEIRADGHDVIEVTNGLELLEVFLGGTPARLRLLPNAIVAETSLPGCSGIEACARLAGLGIDVPFILLTPSCESEAYDDAEKIGAAFVFDKPLDFEGLRNAVAGVSGGW